MPGPDSVHDGQSTAAMRTLAQWRFNVTLQQRVLGAPIDARFDDAAARRARRTDANYRERVRLVLDIDAALRRRLDPAADVAPWFWLPIAEPPFRGTPPAALIASDGAGLLLIAEYLGCLATSRSRSTEGSPE